MISHFSGYLSVAIFAYYITRLAIMTGNEIEKMKQYIKGYGKEVWLVLEPV